VTSLRSFSEATSVEGLWDFSVEEALNFIKSKVRKHGPSLYSSEREKVHQEDL